MITFNLLSGKTVKIDLQKPSDSQKWTNLQADEAFQKSISGVSIHRNGVIQTFPRPKHFNKQKPIYHANLIWHKNDPNKVAAERIVCYVDNLVIDMKVYASSTPPMSRIDVSRQGRLRYNHQNAIKNAHKGAPEKPDG